MHAAVRILVSVHATPPKLHWSLVVFWGAYKAKMQLLEASIWLLTKYSTEGTFLALHEMYRPTYSNIITI